MKIGIIGCGTISSVYFENLRKFPDVQVIACADLDVSKAEAQAKRFNISLACSVDELLQNDEIELVVNLTIPKAHAEVCRKVISAGKHVYVEKPLAIDFQDGKGLIEYAEEKGVRIGVAPDTFLGAGIQTCKKVIDDGVIGRPLSVAAFMMGNGPETFHPNPEFYYEIGGGPMYDMGPYYLTALIQLLGPINRITGSTSRGYEERVIKSKPRAGEKIPVDVPTHITGTLDFTSGVVGTFIMSFDVVTKMDYPNIEIYGTEGTLRVPDPNTFGGPVLLRKPGEEQWQEIQLTHSYEVNARGLGVVDMIDAIKNKRDHRASGKLALHVLEAMHGIHEASDQGKHYLMTSQAASPQPFSDIGIK